MRLAHFFPVVSDVPSCTSLTFLIIMFSTNILILVLIVNNFVLCLRVDCRLSTDSGAKVRQLFEVRMAFRKAFSTFLNLSHLFSASLRNGTKKAPELLLMLCSSLRVQDLNTLGRKSSN